MLADVTGTDILVGKFKPLTYSNLKILIKTKFYYRWWLHCVVDY